MRQDLNSTLEKRVLILKNQKVERSNTPAVMVELGFLSNQNDRTYLTDDNEQERIASTILEFLGEIK